MVSFENIGKGVREILKRFPVDYETEDVTINIPAGYTKMRHISVNESNLVQSPTRPKNYNDECGYACNDSTFTCNIAEVGPVTIKHKGLDPKKQYEIHIPQKNAVLVITKLRISEFGDELFPDRDYSMEAALFLK